MAVSIIKAHEILWAFLRYKASKTAFAMGKDISGAPIVSDISNDPCSKSMYEISYALKRKLEHTSSLDNPGVKWYD